MTLYQGDNTGAFGDVFLTIRIVPREGQIIPEFSKAELKIGAICKTFINPTFPMEINFTEEETAMFNATNTAFLAVWDREGRKRTCNGSIVIKSLSRRV